MQKRHGFTLVELSIVLVIVGLIAGGVLVGRDLIKAAEIRGTISQLESYNTATMIFKDKYKNLPGDITSAQASQYNFAPTSRTDYVAAPLAVPNPIIHGDGLIESCTVTNTMWWSYLAYEVAVFWRDLYSAGLISERFTLGADTMFQPTAILGDYVPRAKISKDAYWILFGVDQGNYFLLASLHILYNGGSLYTNPALSVSDAYAIDAKLDDGEAITGKVRASLQSGSGFDVNLVPPQPCVDFQKYNFANSPSEKTCSLIIKAAF